MIQIGRSINGISLNGLEYLLDKAEEDGGEPIQFESVEKAKEFLKGEGITDETTLIDNFTYYDTEKEEIL